ncbi:glycosyltransferase family 4 protein [Dyadobacter sp. Leaf189]|uniref:glycosyltransferase family 4 protein n=1 Tax=Dyadobacter sp. Leaf189 TaxID=1736295 RepID=UPI0006F57A66|nr:glycosyltransferase family 4 protein [Dyadobacter sp. Leaf189]KQS31016.1 glycosyl transferase family 1 [Dyadobacter sp. Leaf189]
MEILFVSHKYPPAVGGMEKQSYELITGMERYCKVHKIVFDGNESIIRFFILLKKRIIETCAKNPGIKLIHFNDGLLAAFCVRHEGYTHLKRTATLHGLDVVFPSAIYHKNILPRFNRFDKLIAVSNATAKAAVSLGIHAEKLVVIPNGVDTQIPHSRTEVTISGLLAEHGINYRGQRILVALGRPVKRKGMSWFIKNVVPRLQGEFLLLLIGAYQPEPTTPEKLLSFLPKSVSRKITLFLGFPTDNAPLREVLSNPALNARVKHLGKLPTGHVQAILAASAAFIMPNIKVEGDMEGFGLVCLEAAIAGAPVFAADIDGIPDAIQDGKNGYLLPSGNAAAWAERLNEVIQSGPAKPNQEAFRLYTEANFSWDRMVRRYYDLFRSFVELR